MNEVVFDVLDEGDQEPGNCKQHTDLAQRDDQAGVEHQSFAFNRDGLRRQGDTNQPDNQGQWPANGMMQGIIPQVLCFRCYLPQVFHHPPLDEIKE